METKENNLFNIPVRMNIEIKCSVSKESEIIKLTERIGSQATNYIIDLREKALRDSLIKLGWTPPSDRKVTG